MGIEDVDAKKQAKQAGRQAGQQAHNQESVGLGTRSGSALRLGVDSLFPPSLCPPSVPEPRPHPR